MYHHSGLNSLDASEPTLKCFVKRFIELLQRCNKTLSESCVLKQFPQADYIKCISTLKTPEVKAHASHRIVFMQNRSWSNLRNTFPRATRFQILTIIGPNMPSLKSFIGSDH